MRYFLILTLLLTAACTKSTPAPVPAATPASPTSTSTSPTPNTTPPANLKPATLILTDEQIAAGYLQLFDGESLFGWHSTNDKVPWKADAKTGVLSADGEEIGLLLTDVRFQNYELEADVKCAPGANTGLFVHCKADPKKLETDFYEINIADAHPEGFTTGAIVTKAKSERTYPLGDWLHFKIIVQGSHIQVFINGEQALDFNDTSDTKLTSGYIALQKRFGDVAFKNIILKPIFDEAQNKRPVLLPENSGKSWSFDPKKPERLWITKQGLMTTIGDFQDFALSFDVQTGIETSAKLLFEPFKQESEIPNTIDTPAPTIFDLSYSQSPPNTNHIGSLRTVLPSSVNAWHQVQILRSAKGYETFVNGERVFPAADIPNMNESKTILSPLQIQLQYEAGVLNIRNLKITDFGLANPITPYSQNTWRLVPGNKGFFDITSDGSIFVRGGLGFLESTGTYKDFLIQLDAQTLEPNVNTGLFFRALEGTEKAPSHGYEMQIDNSLKDGNPMTPANAGTGAIFRRNIARRIVSKDNELAHITLVADGLTFMSWVNGYPVSDWTDTRPPSDNPREGSKQEAGHLSLQGHDPGTKAEFKNIRIQPYE
jgi:hypothetical protein